MLEALITISPDSRCHSLMILTEKREIGASIYSRKWHIKFKRISSSYFDIAANSEKSSLGISKKNDVVFCSALKQVRL